MCESVALAPKGAHPTETTATVTVLGLRSPGRSRSLSTLGPSGLPDRPVFRFDLPIIAEESATWNGTRVELVTGGKTGPHEIEIFQPAHILCMRFNGVSPGYDWTDGSIHRRVATLRPGTVLFTPANRYSWVGKKSHAGGSFIRLSIRQEEVEVLKNDSFDADRVEFRQQPQLEDAAVARTLFAIKDEIKDPGPGGKLYRSLLVQQLLVQLVRCCSNLAPDRVPVYVKGGLSGWQLRRALELLEANLNEPPSLTTLAAHVRLSPTYLCTAFRESMGEPPHRYLVNRRIAKAKELMANRELSLTEIALATGFGSSSRFSIAFRKAVGAAPSEYRRAM